MSYKFKNGYRKYNLHLKFYSGKTFSNIPDQITNILPIASIGGQVGFTLMDGSKA